MKNKTKVLLFFGILFLIVSIFGVFFDPSFPSYISCINALLVIYIGYLSQEKSIITYKVKLNNDNILPNGTKVDVDISDMLTDYNFSGIISGRSEKGNYIITCTDGTFPNSNYDYDTLLVHNSFVQRQK